MIESFTYEDMGKLINEGKASVLKTSQRRNGHHVYKKLVSYNNEEYLLCNYCNKYLLTTFFTVLPNKFAERSDRCKNVNLL